MDQGAPGATQLFSQFNLGTEPGHDLGGDAVNHVEIGAVRGDAVVVRSCLAASNAPGLPLPVLAVALALAPGLSGALEGDPGGVGAERGRHQRGADECRQRGATSAAWVRKATKHLESSALMTRSFHESERIKMRSLIADYHDSEPEPIRNLARFPGTSWTRERRRLVCRALHSGTCCRSPLSAVRRDRARRAAHRRRS